MKVSQLVKMLEDFAGSGDPEVKIMWWDGGTEDISNLRNDDGDVLIEAMV